MASTPAIDVALRYSTRWVTPACEPSASTGSSALGSGVSTTDCGVIIESIRAPWRAAGAARG